MESTGERCPIHEAHESEQKGCLSQVMFSEKRKGGGSQTPRTSKGQLSQGGRRREISRKSRKGEREDNRQKTDAQFATLFETTARKKEMAGHAHGKEEQHPLGGVEGRQKKSHRCAGIVKAQCVQGLPRRKAGKR